MAGFEFRLECDFVKIRYVRICQQIFTGDSESKLGGFTVLSMLLLFQGKPIVRIVCVQYHISRKLFIGKFTLLDH